MANNFDEWDYSDLVDFAEEATLDIAQKNAQLAAANARIAELEAWKAAVPVRAIEEAYEGIYYDAELRDWLKKVVQP